MSILNHDPTLRLLLVQCGLTEKEAQIYLHLLENGPKVAREVAEETGIKRANAYYILSKLEEQNLIKIDEKGSKNVYIVRHPKSWEDFFKEKKRDLEEYEKRIWDSMPKLVSRYELTKNESGVYIFHGREEIIKQLQNVLDEAKEVKLVVSKNGLAKTMPDFKAYFLKTLKRKKIDTKVLVNSKEKELEEHKYLSLRIIHHSVIPNSIDVFMNEEKMVLISNEGDTPFMILVSFPHIVSNFMSAFDAYWTLSGITSH
jgi:sugar-specific transcriptional regulator TrmB